MDEEQNITQKNLTKTWQMYGFQTDVYILRLQAI